MQIMDSLIKKIHDNITANDLFAGGDRVLLSLSAGKDSMLLFHACMELIGYLGIRIGVFHLNHCLRGEESDMDEAFIQMISIKANIPYFIEKHDFLNEKHGGMSPEEYYRNVRYQIASRVAGINNYNKIATAHTLDDNIETVLMRIFTGTGIHGLCGIMQKNGLMIRPLLSVTSKEVYDFLIRQNIKWREDSSNADTKFQRNYVRNSVLPILRKRFPMIDKAINSLSNNSNKFQTLLHDMVFEKYGAFCEKINDLIIINADNYLHNDILLGEIIAAAIRNEFNSYITAGIIAEIIKKTRGKWRKKELYKNSRFTITALFNGNKIIEIKKSADLSFIPVWQHELPGVFRKNRYIYIDAISIHLVFGVVDWNFFCRNRHRSDYVFIGINSAPISIIIRNRRNGDKILTECGTKKIKDLLIEKKLDNADKDKVPILSIDGQIAAFMPGLVFDTLSRVSKAYFVNEKTENILLVRCHNRLINTSLNRT
jgi:tRNA(Ile)-lysidine synthase